MDIAEENGAPNAGSKPQIDFLLRLGMYSLASLICFWFPFVIIYKYGEYDDGRSTCACFIVFPFIMFVFIYSIMLLARLFSSLKKNNSRKRFLFVFCGVLISSPSLIAGILIMVTIARIAFQSAF